MKQRTPVKRNIPGYLWLGLAAVVLAVGYFTLRNDDSRAAEAPRLGLPPTAVTGAAPAFTLVDLAGKKVSLSDFQGKIVVLDFWATWCPPCRREIPDFISLQNQYASQGVQIVGIALDEPEKVQAFARENGMNYPVLLGDNAISAKYGGIEGIPTTFIIDRSGRIVNRFEGFRPRETFETEIRKLL